jgi:iron(II)-dependent oxidoreductase
MAGNVSEWVSDWYQADFYTQQLNNAEANPKGPATGTQKVHRGGSWDTIPLFLRSVHRMSLAPDAPGASVGFRCVTSGPSATAPAGTTTGTGGEAAPSGGAPTLPPQPTQPLLPTSTPSGTLDPGSGT